MPKVDLLQISVDRLERDLRRTVQEIVTLNGQLDLARRSLRLIGEELDEARRALTEEIYNPPQDTPCTSQTTTPKS